MLVALVQDEKERRRIEMAVWSRDEIVVCEAATQLAVALDSRRPSKIVCAPQAAYLSEACDTIRAFALRGHPAPVFLVCDLSPAAAEEVARLARAAIDVRVWLRSEGLFGNALAAFVAGGVPDGPEAVMLRKLPQGRSRTARLVITIAILLGARKRDVAALSAASGMSIRSLQRLLYAEGLPSPRELLGLSMTVHSMYRIDCMGWSVASTSDFMGYRESHQLVHAISRRTGMPPRRLSHTAGFHEVLDRFERAIEITCL